MFAFLQHHFELEYGDKTSEKLYHGKENVKGELSNSRPPSLWKSLILQLNKFFHPFEIQEFENELPICDVEEKSMNIARDHQ